MIASAIGSPSAPARAADSGVPPTATQIGIRSCNGRGYTPRVVRAVAKFEQLLELLGEQPVVVRKVVAEERERLDERAAAGHDLRAAARKQIDRRKLLEDAHRVVGAQHAHSACQPDRLRAFGSRREHDGRRRHCEVGPVVLADAEDVEPDLVGELDFL